MKSRLVLLFLTTTFFSFAQSEYQVSIEKDYYLTISKPFGYEYESIKLNIFNKDNHFVLDTAIREDQELNFTFPSDFEVLAIDSISLSKPDNFTFEILEKKKKEYESDFLYDNSINGLLQPRPIEYGALSEYSFRGDFIDAYDWFDKDGEHIAILSKQEFKDSLSTTYIYLNHFDISENAIELTRQYVDTYRACGDSLAAQFYLPTFQLTDLDKDSIGEISIIYQVNCLNNEDRYISYKMLLDDNGKKYMGYYELDRERENQYWGDSYAKSKPIFNRFLEAQLMRFCEDRHSNSVYGDK